LRPSSPDIAAIVADTALAAGVDVVDCGALPTPALALASMAAGGGAIMVTGSHIPADRNGLKFYSPRGEISKADEAAILVGLGKGAGAAPHPGRRIADTQAGARFVTRYLSAFGGEALEGLRIGLYAHSSVGRDLLAKTLDGLGAEIIELGRSESFIPVDTEAVDPETRARLRAWSAEYRFDAIVSTDGDTDRPLLVDESGTVIPGDLLGQITSAAMGVDILVTPVTSNSGAEASGHFARVIRTQIGSPYVIAGMEAAGGKVAGYEANGGYILGFTMTGPAGQIAPLWTRDCFLPLIVPLMVARGTPLSQIVASEISGVTRAACLRETPIAQSALLTEALRESDEARQGFLGNFGEILAATDLTDGVRMTTRSGCIVHIRPSGNAPELRLYVEATTSEKADLLLETGLAALRQNIARILATTSS
jgi:phosphomannomutase